MSTVSKKTAKPCVTEVIRRMPHSTRERAEELLAPSAGGLELQTVFSKRFHGTMREHLASLTRHSRHAIRRLVALEAGMWLAGGTYPCC